MAESGDFEAWVGGTILEVIPIMQIRAEACNLRLLGKLFRGARAARSYGHKDFIHLLKMAPPLQEEMAG
jgi:hypothetical protein